MTQFSAEKSNARRAEIRKNIPDAHRPFWTRLRSRGLMPSLLAALAFWLLASGMLVMRENVVRYRPGMFARHDIVARTDFSYSDQQKLDNEREEARRQAIHVFKPADKDIWKATEDELLALPDRVKGATLADLPADLASLFKTDPAALTKLQEYSSPADRDKYISWVHDYIAAVKAAGIVIISEQQRLAENGRVIQIQGLPQTTRIETTYVVPADKEDIAGKLLRIVESRFPLTLQPKVVQLTLRHLDATHVLDEVATADARNRMAEMVPTTAGRVVKKADMTIVDVPPGGREIKPEDYYILKEENQAYLDSLGNARWGQRAGIATIVLLMTAVVSVYVGRFQPRIGTNPARAWAISALLLAMLLLGQLAALGSSTIYFFGIAPTILVAMILCIAYDQRFALGMAMFHAVLVTLALDADISFMAILATGVVTCCFLLDDLRTRSKLIEVGGATALAMIVATAAAGMLRFDPLPYIAHCCLYTGAAGLAVGFVVLGILPFIEKTFRITTSLTLLELADVSHPLLRRLSVEASGTHKHSLQVATLAEAAAEAIGANSLLCRVAAYYHDVGKINKADYFVENQVDGHNRHLNLSPSVSLLIIIGHVKDGLELAKEYNLPTSLSPFIQQHHGTTLVEFFYHRACDTCTPDDPVVSETQYRYPGPKPKTREIAILMLADAAESASRSLSEPTAPRIETLVHELAMKRLHDGQFDDCPLTLRELHLVERSLVKTLLSIYHGRIAYPSTAALTSAPSAAVAPPAQSPSARTA